VLRHRGLTFTAAFGDSKRYRASGLTGGGAKGVADIMKSTWEDSWRAMGDAQGEKENPQNFLYTKSIGTRRF
jgi:hypothetical protein